MSGRVGRATRLLFAFHDRDGREIARRNYGDFVGCSKRLAAHLWGCGLRKDIAPYLLHPPELICSSHWWLAAG
jgi:hypothetical protein